MTSPIDIEEIRETIWQKYKQEENALIKEIEHAHAKLKQLQLQYTVLETKISHEVADTIKITQKRNRLFQ
jgi:hypothetical protein